MNMIKIKTELKSPNAQYSSPSNAKVIITITSLYHMLMIKIMMHEIKRML